MKKIKLLFYTLNVLILTALNQVSFTQHFSTFTSLVPTVQNNKLQLPATHTFQVLAKEGDLRSDGLPMQGWLDFAGYVGVANSSTQGHVLLNQEIGPGGTAVLPIQYDNATKLWIRNAINQVDFSAVGGTYGNCSGGITPWGTFITAEEHVTGTDVNGDGYGDIGWLTEIVPATAQIKDYGSGKQKLWSLGHIDHENVAIKSDGTIAYTGSDHSTYGFILKFVPTIPNNLTNGILYGLKKTSATTADWIEIATNTIAEKTNTRSQCIALGITNFSGIEDIEIGPDGKVYFADKDEGNVYRFIDNGNAITNLEIFIGPSISNFAITHSTGSSVANWGNGCDNLCFDNNGNLYVCQDGSGISAMYNYVWMIKPTHTMSSPQVELFAITPAGSEPTGITFTPDYKFMFLSIQHPNATNAANQIDAANENINFDKHTTVIIALKENLGNAVLPLNINSFTGLFLDNNSIKLSWDINNPSEIIQFDILKSTNGITFSKVESLLANTLNRDYTFTDFTNIDVEKVYYKLRIHSKNNQKVLSNIIALKNNTKIKINSIAIVPNPLVQGSDLHFRIDYAEKIVTNAYISILTLEGKTVLIDKLPIRNGVNAATLRLPNLAKENYVLRVNIDGELYSKMFIIN